jgi:hypothetical protein
MGSGVNAWDPIRSAADQIDRAEANEWTETTLV